MDGVKCLERSDINIQSLSLLDHLLHVPFRLFSPLTALNPGTPRPERPKIRPHLHQFITRKKGISATEN